MATPEPEDSLHAFLERFASVLVAAGFPAMPARVFAALHVTDSGRLTAAELADMLRISPAAVSGAVRYLSGLGLVHRERVPGSRRGHYPVPPAGRPQGKRRQTQRPPRPGKLPPEGSDPKGGGT